MATETVAEEHHVRTATYAPLPQAASAARRLLTEQLPAWGLADVIEDAGLVATELVANAIRSGRPIRLTVCASEDAVRIEVFDTSPEPPRRCAPDTCDETGRGLLLVEACAERWGHRRVAGGKVVWATLLRAAPASGR